MSNRCSECSNFSRDTIGDGEGIGDCDLGYQFTAVGKTRWPLYANRFHECESFEGEGLKGEDDSAIIPLLKTKISASPTLDLTKHTQAMPNRNPSTVAKSALEEINSILNKQ